MGELEAEKVQLEQRMRRFNEDIRVFRVLPEYREIEAQSNNITAEMHQLTNENIADKRLLSLYRGSIVGEARPEAAEVLQLYELARVELPGAVKRRLEEVQAFHELIVANRRDFLQDEVVRLERAIARRHDSISQLSDRRAALLETLRTHRALDEFQALQRNALEVESHKAGFPRPRQRHL